jgi:hypothetical protein
MRFGLLVPAGLPLLAAWVLSSIGGVSGWRRGTVAAIDVLALLSTVWLWNAGVGPDRFGLFLAASVLGALIVAALSPERQVEILGRLHLGASVAIAAASTSELSWSVAAVLLFGIVVRQGNDRLLLYLLPGFAALVGVALVLAFDSTGLGSALLAAGLSTWWIVVSREVLRSSTSGLVTRMTTSFLLLVAVSSVLLRMAAWIPEATAFGVNHALAMSALALGALGALGATRITTFLTALSLARAGLVLFALLGGVQGRAPSLMALVASGASLLLLAAALDRTDTIDGVSNLGSISRRLVLVLGALSVCSLPPFPGFVALFPLSSAVLQQSYSLSLLVAAGLHFLLAIGSMRVVARAWDSGAARSVDTGVGLAAIGLAIAATFSLSIAPSRFVELARAAALAIL